VLTTHHLEEVEALADRAAIMVGGRIECLGTLEHLKATLGVGYQVAVRVDDVSYAQSVEQRLQHEYPGCVKLVEHHQTKLNFTVKNGPSTSLSSLFGLLHEMKTSRDTQDSFGVIDYTVSQSSVEEVFLAVAGGGTHGPAHDTQSAVVPSPTTTIVPSLDAAVKYITGSFTAPSYHASPLRQHSPLSSQSTSLFDAALQRNDTYA
jgi:hypothetical protein